MLERQASSRVWPSGLVIVRASLAHEPAARRDDEPQAPVLRDVLATDLPRVHVVHVVVKRPPVVGHLQPAVLAPGRPDQRLLDALSGLERGRLVIHRPGRGGGAVAPALAAAAIAREGIERPALSVEQDPAVARLPDG